MNSSITISDVIVYREYNLYEMIELVCMIVCSFCVYRIYLYILKLITNHEIYYICQDADSNLYITFLFEPAQQTPTEFGNFFREYFLTNFKFASLRLD